MPKQKTTDVTNEVPTLDENGRKNVKKVAFIGLGAAAAILFVDDQVKKFKNRKAVKVTVVDKTTEA